jgi:YD repeat-containing protein
MSVYVLLPGGGQSYFEFTNGWATNYHNNFRLQVLTDGSGNVTSYELHKPDGSKIIYDFFRTFTVGTWSEVFMTRQISPEGFLTRFDYPNYDPETGDVRLKYVVDADGRTNTLTYLPLDGQPYNYGPNRVGTVTDPYQRSASFGRTAYPAPNRLTSITDAVGISSQFDYDSNGWPSSMTTPYGTTTFTITGGGSIYEVDRTIIIREPGGAGQVYSFEELCNMPELPSYLPPAYPASQVPTNTPIGTLDNKPDVRNSFYWSRQTYDSLPQAFKDTGDFLQLSAADYLKARMRHWLGGADLPDKKPIDTLSIERAPSPDGGITEGQKTWYDYANKGPHGNDDKGPQIQPSVVARVLPDGSTWYQYFQRNSWGRATNLIEKWNVGWTGNFRTNRFFYDATGIDLLEHRFGPSGSDKLLAAYVYDPAHPHQPVRMTNALNQTTYFTYDALHRLSTAQTPAGLLSTHTYGADGYLSKVLDSAVGGSALRTNSYTWLNGQVRTRADPRGLT